MSPYCVFRRGFGEVSQQAGFGDGLREFGVWFVPIALREEVEDLLIEFAFEEVPDLVAPELGAELLEGVFEGVEGFGEVGFGGDGPFVVLDFELVIGLGELVVDGAGGAREAGGHALFEDAHEFLAEVGGADDGGVGLELRVRGEVGVLVFDDGGGDVGVAPVEEAGGLGDFGHDADVAEAEGVFLVC